MSSQVTALITAADPSDLSTLDRLVPLIYQELREMAHRQLGKEGRNQSLQTTDLVHETYLRLVDDTGVTKRGRAYFYGAAARAMRQILVDAARRKQSAKRGRGIVMLDLDHADAPVNAYAGELLDLDEALRELEKLNPRQARVVECRYFGGLNVEETAAALNVSPRTVKSDWALAKAWLFDALRGG
ncbi:MAG TPA: sigma-70 family RNA polymerase sigma factor [Gemmatimonadaceae bacterium]|jgi:RNA polymerase sigma factor (TIGR02999 family)